MKMKNIIVILFAILLLGFIAACSPSELPELGQPVQEVIQTQSGTYIDINVAQMEAMLKNKDFLIVNVHIPYEGEIGRTDIHIPFDQISNNLSRLPADKNAKIVLYCRSGRMSTIAAQELVQLGYTNIWQLKGGMVDWQNAGLPLFER